jgi:hypothetical protein
LRQVLSRTVALATLRREQQSQVACMLRVEVAHRRQNQVQSADRFSGRGPVCYSANGWASEQKDHIRAYLAVRLVSRAPERAKL